MIRLTDAPRPKFTQVYYNANGPTTYWIQAEDAHLVLQTLADVPPPGQAIKSLTGLKVWRFSDGPECEGKKPLCTNYQYPKYLCLEKRSKKS